MKVLVIEPTSGARLVLRKACEIAIKGAEVVLAASVGIGQSKMLLESFNFAIVTSSINLEEVKNLCLSLRGHGDLQIVFYVGPDRVRCSEALELLTKVVHTVFIEKSEQIAGHFFKGELEVVDSIASAISSGVEKFSDKKSFASSFKSGGSSTLHKDFLTDEMVTPIHQKNFDQQNFRKRKIRDFIPEIIIIGSSTGGPEALEKIFAGLSKVRKSNIPILIVQHMPPVFTKMLSERLEKYTGIVTTEAQDGDLLVPNHIFVAPGDYHVRVFGTRKAARLALDKGPLICSVRPAVDPLFFSVSSIFLEGTMAYVLTGMGQDGAEGSCVVKQNGGTVCIQSKETCVVYGMPGAVEELGAYDEIKTPEQISEIISLQVT